MKKGNLKKINEIVKSIDQKSMELADFLSNIGFLSRKNMLQEITRDIIKNSKLMKDMGVDKGIMLQNGDQEEPLLVQSLIENTIAQIKAQPVKKVIFLREFLNGIPDISDGDKNVILQSLKDEEDDKLRDKMLLLVKTFDLKL